jgi:hypothetical protein
MTLLPLQELYISEKKNKYYDAGYGFVVARAT